MIDFSRYDDQPEFQAALREFFSSLDPELLEDPKYKTLLPRLVEPDRVITFDVAWEDDNGVLQHNKGYRVQFNNVNGVYKGGLRFHPTVNLSVLKFLAFEQIFKNYLTTLPMGGAKGGSDFDPKGKSDAEVIRFCRAFMRGLYPCIGAQLDVPAGDIGVGAREIRALYEAYKEYSGKSDCALTGKPLDLGGSLCRKEATGYGVVYFAKAALKAYIGDDDFSVAPVIISGSGNVALYCLQKVTELGGKVVAMNDSDNTIYCEDGIDFETLRALKEDRRGRIREYANLKPNVEVLPSKAIWGIPCGVAFPCATQFELDVEDAKKLIANRVYGVFEGANMPCTQEAAELFIANRVIYSPGKASNAGGVAVSGLEIEQNAKGEKWSFEQVDARLKEIMETIFGNCLGMARMLCDEYNLVKGANNYAFLGIANKMLERK